MSTTEELQAQFEAAAEKIKVWKPAGKDPSDDEKLELYALFKQGTVGDVNSSRPGFLDFVGRKKWDAWNAKKGMSKEDAMKAYIAEVERQITTYGTKA